MLDTGQDVPYYDYPSSRAMVTQELVTSSEPGWQGPYIPFSTADFIQDVRTIQNSNKYSFKFSRVVDYVFGSYTTSAGNNKSCYVDAGACYNSIIITGITLDQAQYFDEAIDGTISANTGKIRVSYYSGEYSIIYMFMPALRQS